MGCGGIARGAHLPAYRNFGYRVVACCDVAPGLAENTAHEFGIPFATTELEALLARPDVHVVDLAVHAAQRPPLVERIAAAGKPILSQKPFALNMADAEHMVWACERANVPLMINQQARWAPAHRALRRVLDLGLLGHLYSVLHIHRGFQDVPGSWYVALEHFNILDHGIHFIDLSRFFTGAEPVTVKAVTTRIPGQVAVTPMIYTIGLEYAPSAELMATLHFNNIVRAPLHEYRWYLDGTLGSAWASPRELVLQLADGQPAQRFALEGNWFNEAFGGSMGEMLSALAEGREPATSGRDNLRSVRIAYAAVESSESGRAVALPPE